MITDLALLFAALSVAASLACILALGVTTLLGSGAR